MSSRTYDQFIRFTTDTVGLERTFRLFQAVVQILSSYPFLFGLLIHALGLATGQPPSPATTQVVLLDLRQRLGLARRFFRLFRFLDSFNSAHKLYLSISPSNPPNARGQSPWVQREAWLDILGRTFNGMYLLLETSTMVDALEIDGLRLWTPDWGRTITVEAQRFWLFSLVCGLFSGLLKMLNVLAHTPVPTTGDGFAHGKTEGNVRTENEKADQESEFDMKKEQERLRNIVRNRKKGRALWAREVRAKMRGLGRNTLANALDILLPGTVVGWVKVDPGTVGLAMFVTTLLTGMDAWERCGREVAENK
ncbi:AoPex11B [Xylariales sp. AK1849]|nr:AoPex11B [Xylariales sp. AK1849]